MNFQLSEAQRTKGNIAALRVIFFLLFLMLAIVLRIIGIEHPLPVWFGWLFWSTMGIMAILVAAVWWLDKRLEKLQQRESNPLPT